MQGGGESEARYMRRKVKAGLIEADHADCAIVVHYEVEATVLGDMGEPIVAERQDNVKRIKLKTLNENTNIARLAQEMVEKCKLIHPSKLPLVETLLEELQEHQARQERGGGQGASSRRQRPGTATREPKKGKSKSAEEPPSLERLDQYVECMYDGVEAAAQATHMILQLARSPDNLEGLLNNESLLGCARKLEPQATASPPPPTHTPTRRPAHRPHTRAHRTRAPRLQAARAPA